MATAMTDQDRGWQLVEVGVVSTLVSIPIGIWLLKNTSHLTAAIGLTALSFAVKHFMLGGGGE